MRFVLSHAESNIDGVDNVICVDGFLESQKCLNVFGLVVWNIFNTCFIFPYIGLFIIPTDFHIFQSGRSTTNQNMFEEITVDHMGFWWGSWRVAPCPCRQSAKRPQRFVAQETRSPEGV